MEELEALEEERRRENGTGEAQISGGAGVRGGAAFRCRKRRGGRGAVPRGMASDEMCTFLVINISSLQLIPINMIAYRTQYGSANPMAVVGPALLATAVSTAVGVVFCKVMNQRRQRV